MTVFLLMITSFISAFIQTTTGFGYGILFMAISPFFLVYPVAQVLSMSVSPLGNMLNVSKRYKSINYKQVFIPLIVSTVSSHISIVLSKGMDMSILKRTLGVLLFLLAIWFIFFSKKVKIKPTISNCVIAGLLSGIGGGLFSISGPPVVVYYLSALEDKEEYMATIQSYFFLSSIITLGQRYILGTFPTFSIEWLIVCFIGLGFGYLVGSKLYSRLNGEVLKMYVYAFMALSGLLIFIQG